jgi:hypothetical protein
MDQFCIWRLNPWFHHHSARTSSEIEVARVDTSPEIAQAIENIRNDAIT